MPGRDRTGSAGSGPMKGRSVGFCAGYPVPGSMDSAVGGAGFYAIGVPAVGQYCASLYMVLLM